MTRFPRMTFKCRITNHKHIRKQIKIRSDHPPYSHQKELNQRLILPNMVTKIMLISKMDVLKLTISTSREAYQEDARISLIQIVKGTKLKLGK